MSDSFFSELGKRKTNERASTKQFAQIRKNILSDLLLKQRQVIEDKGRYKSALCPRRAGKTYMAIRYAAYVALAKRDAVVVITTLTLKSAKRLYWRELRELLDMHGVAYKPHHTTLEVTLAANGSKIFLAGAETQADIERLRGGQYDLVIVDECKSFHPLVFRDFVDDVMSPALLDRGGSLLLIGTPGTELAGPFYEATCPEYKTDNGVHACRPWEAKDDMYWKARRARWSFHTWTQQDNTAQPQIWEGALELKEINNWPDDHPTWLREYLGKWVAGENARVFMFTDANTRADGKGDPLCTYFPDENVSSNPFGLEEGHEWIYALGVDLGYEDSTAFVIAAWSPTNPVLFYPWCYKAQHMRTDDIAQTIKRLEAMVGGFAGMVADTGGLGKMIVETLNFEHGFTIEPAKKQEKLDHIELMNGDYLSGRIKHAHGSPLSDEMNNLMWDLSRGTKTEQLRKGKLLVERDSEDHLADAALYVYRYVHHKLSREKVTQLKRGSREWQEEQERLAFERALERRSQESWALETPGKDWENYE